MCVHYLVAEEVSGRGFVLFADSLEGAPDAWEGKAFFSSYKTQETRKKNQTLSQRTMIAKCLRKKKT